jgi:division protein CdvB (Snf7/Vps24/ESCRT-III family)
VKWEDNEKVPLYERIKDKVGPKSSLKPLLDKANKRILVQIKNLDRAANKLSKRDKSLFNRVVKAYSKHDSVRAKVYANELAEIRKTTKQIGDTKLALEQISLRLGTVSDFGDVVSTLSPSVSVLQNIGNGISKTMPKAGKELSQIGNLLNGVIAESNQGTGIDIDFETPNDEAKNILSEASKVAKESIKQQLPETPTDTSAVKKKVSTNT